MKTRNELIGKKFGKLLVVNYEISKEETKRSGWKCVCDCGVEIVIRTHDLVAGRMKSCGCSQGKRKDITGKKFNRLLVLEMTEIKKKGYYFSKCLCDCGKIVLIRNSALCSGNTKSCGCLSREVHQNIRATFEDLTGKTFGKLTVVKEGTRDRRKAKWDCMCSCGNKISVIASYLKTGDTTSCGCFFKEKLSAKSKYKRLTFEDAILLKMTTYHEKSALRRDLTFELRKEEIKEFIFGNCYYCGSSPSQVNYISGHQKTFLVNGIDRVDSRKGYIKNNCVSCCVTCNRMKSSHGVEKFLSQIEKIYKRMSKEQE